MMRDVIRFCGVVVLALTVCGLASAGRARGRPKPKEEEEKVVAPAPRARPKRAARVRGSSKRAIFDELSKEASAADRLKASEAQALYEQGLAAYEDLRYEQAKKLFEHALRTWRDHRNAKAMLVNTRALLGYHRDVLMKAMSDLTNEKKVKMQDALIEIKNVLASARRYYEKAHVAQIGDEDREIDAILARQIKDLDEAMTRYNRALEVIRWLPYNINLTEYKDLALDMRNRCDGERRKRHDDLKSYQTQRAILKAQERKREERKFYRDRMGKLFAQAMRYFDYKQYDSCERMCKEILKIDPRFKEAESLIYKARRAKHELLDWRTYTDTKYHRKAVRMQVSEASIPYARTIVYPKYWDKIVERVDTATAVGMAHERAWEKEIERALDKKVSFEFVETPLSEAISFLQTLTKVNMILDPKATEGSETPINLKVSNMSLKLALDWILKLADLDYALRDDAIFISTPEQLSEDVLLRMYDVRDLTQIIQDFPGPDFELMFGGTQQQTMSQIVITTDVEADVVTASSLAEMIQSRVKPDSWAAELGTSIEERGGKLVVMQRPEVHKLIGRLLESFRATQKLLVTVEARFLEISERFFQEIGWQWGGLGGETGQGPATDPIINDLAGGVISSQTLMDPELPSGNQVDTGMVFHNQDLGDDDWLHVIGAIHTGGIGDSQRLNARPWPSPEDTELGVLMTPPYTDIDQRLLRQGLDAQITYLGKMEAMAFLHALKVREAGTVLTAPRLTVYNTQRAHMFVATQRSYIADYEVSGDMYDPVIRQFLMGVVLDVKPIVSSDRRYITVELRPTTAELIEMQGLTIQAIHVIGTDPPVVTSQFLPIEFPIVELRKVRTTVTIPDGGIIMIGGMMKDVNFRGTTGVPFLSHLPIIGKLFRWDLEDKEQESLSILLTARLLIFEEEERKL